VESEASAGAGKEEKGGDEVKEAVEA
jgi:hypothetical protein